MTQISLKPTQISGDHFVHFGQLPGTLLFGTAEFTELWNMHPAEHSVIKIMGKQTPVPRWDKAYGRDYPFSGQIAVAEPIPELLRPLLEWVQGNVESTANGLFVNWHDGSQSHYHGKHRDSTAGVIPGTPITTISFGEARVFRMRPYPRATPPIDFDFRDRDVIVIPWETNKHWYHEIPKLSRHRGLRTSVTIRSFK